jgi:hypothetical protein
MGVLPGGMARWGESKRNASKGDGAAGEQHCHAERSEASRRPSNETFAALRVTKQGYCMPLSAKKKSFPLVQTLVAIGAVAGMVTLAARMYRRPRETLIDVVHAGMLLAGIREDRSEDSPGSSTGGSERRFHASTFPPGEEKQLLCGFAPTFGQTRSGSGETRALGQDLPRFRTLNGSLVCCPQARLRTFPANDILGTRGGGFCWIQIGG